MNAFTFLCSEIEENEMLFSSRLIIVYTAISKIEKYMRDL